MDKDMALTPEEEKVIREIFADPKRKYQFLTLVSRQLKEFDAWCAEEKKKEATMAEDKKQVSFLQKLISGFNS